MATKLRNMDASKRELNVNLSTVVTGSSDWSLVPLAERAMSVTIAVERETKHETRTYGGSLWTREELLFRR